MNEVLRCILLGNRKEPSMGWFFDKMFGPVLPTSEIIDWVFSIEKRRDA